MSLSDALFIARQDVSHLLRQRETLLWVVVMPVLFFYFIGTVTGGMAPSSSSVRTPLTVDITGEGGFLADHLAERLEEQGFELTNDSDTRLEVGSSRFTEDVLAETQVVLTLRASDPGPTFPFDQIRVARAVYSLVGDLAITPTPSSDALAELHHAERLLTIAVESAGERKIIPSGFEQAVPGILVMFTMLVLLTGGAALHVMERELGLLRRLATTPLTQGSVVLGKWLARMTLAVVQIAVGLVTGSVLFSMDWGGSLPMVLVVLLGWAALNASLGLLLGNIARTSSQSAGFGVLVTMVLAALGGCWWPIEITPGWMQSLALVFPSGWTMDAIHALVSFGQDARSAVPHAAALFSSAIVAGVAAAKTFRYS